MSVPRDGKIVLVARSNSKYVSQPRDEPAGDEKQPQSSEERDLEDVDLDNEFQFEGIDGKSDSEDVELILSAEKPTTKPSGPSPLSHSILLDSFKLEKRIRIGRAVLAKSPYFEQRFASCGNLESMKIKLPRFATVESMICAIEFLATGKVFVEKRFFFELLAVAHWLKLDKLISLCATRIATSLSYRNIIIACHFAYRCGLNELLAECYRWILIHIVEAGVLPELLNQHIQSNAQGPPPVTLPLSQAALQYGRYFVPLDAFSPLLEASSSFNLRYSMPIQEHFFGTVRRDRSGPSHTYRLFANGSEEPILAARRLEAIGEYVISSHRDDVNLHDRNYVGAVRSNLTGTEFLIFDDGVSTDVDPAVFPLRPRQQKGMIIYERNILGNQPRSFQIVLPKAGVEENLNISGDYYQNDLSRLMVLKNKPPVWNQEIEAYTLDFMSYVKLPSKKNFQLVTEDNLDKLYLMFGKIERDVFHIDFINPITILQAFAIALSSLDRKLIVT
eukprot:TRINITY_DN973_c0_g1_i1.p1 TRINITY_DN973_c0_g1~~TRINITY_DN973_c0_g1_i1.p1  ORF type:complete len:503 (-),score=90.46 TRINITY_DN973_c0_g1_i1:141-1649(-)